MIFLLLCPAELTMNTVRVIYLTPFVWVWLMISYSECHAVLQYGLVQQLICETSNQNIESNLNLCKDYWPTRVTLLTSSSQKEPAQTELLTVSLLTPCMFLNRKYQLLPSNRWFRVPQFKCNRLKNSFIHQSILLLNQVFSNVVLLIEIWIQRIWCDMYDCHDCIMYGN